MLSLLQRPYVFSFAIAVITAVLVWLYNKAIKKESERVNSSFFITLVAGLVVAAGLTHLQGLAGPVDMVVSEPFDAVVAGVGAAGVGGV